MKDDFPERLQAAQRLEQLINDARANGRPPINLITVTCNQLGDQIEHWAMGILSLVLFQPHLSMLSIQGTAVEVIRKHQADGNQISSLAVSLCLLAMNGGIKEKSE